MRSSGEIALLVGRSQILVGRSHLATTFGKHFDERCLTTHFSTCAAPLARSNSALLLLHLSVVSWRRARLLLPEGWRRRHHRAASQPPKSSPASLRLAATRQPFRPEPLALRASCLRPHPFPRRRPRLVPRRHRSSARSATRIHSTQWQTSLSSSVAYSRRCVGVRVRVCVRTCQVQQNGIPCARAFVRSLARSC